MSAVLSPVRHSIVVDVAAERAFRLFTEGFDKWWPRSHHIGKAETYQAFIEPRVGGRWYERGGDGVECEWGRVLAWEPPSRVLLAWQIGPTWQYDPNADHASEVEVRFVAESPTRTRVELEHRNFERHGEGHEQLRESVAAKDGWPMILGRLGDAARGLTG